MKTTFKANIIIDVTLEPEEPKRGETMVRVYDPRYPINGNMIRKLIESGKYELEYIESYLSTDYNPTIIIKEKKNG